ncbi:MAG: SsrA-binding protein SmpB [Candidatus Nomurabacteria bacterium]|nr:SsrA-binding protein SmpB [Candidatus Nomurabacteria bacterium]
MALPITNKKATFNYEILDTFEAGLVLLGHEVKSLKTHTATLEGSYVIIRGGEVFLTGAHIPPYQPGNVSSATDPYRNRKLLLNKKEIAELEEAEHQPGIAIIPLKIFTKNNNIKIKIATARGKKQHDKRQNIKKRDIEREIGRKLK